MDVTAFKKPTEVLATCSVATPNQLVATLAWLTPSGPSSMEGILFATLPGLGANQRRRAATYEVPDVNNQS
jgi:hypothetical protein